MVPAFTTVGRLHRRSMLLLSAAAVSTATWPRRTLANAPPPLDQRLLAILGNIIIPATATPGAGEPTQVAFVSRALVQGMDGTSPQTLRAVHQALDRATSHDFLAAPPARQFAAVTALDQRAYTGMATDHVAWRQIKGLIMAAYYTSEAGCTKELTYDLAPGRWDYDIPLTAADRAIANDWFAVSFR